MLDVPTPYKDRYQIGIHLAPADGQRFERAMRAHRRDKAADLGRVIILDFLDRFESGTREVVAESTTPYGVADVDAETKRLILSKLEQLERRLGELEARTPPPQPPKNPKPRPNGMPVA